MESPPKDTFVTVYGLCFHVGAPIRKNSFVISVFFFLNLDGKVFLF